MEINYFESSPSTNTALLELSKKSAKSWTVCWTANQTQGRGYAGNEWEIEKGKNIAVSVLIKSELVYNELIYFNQWVCNVIHRFLSGFSDEVFIKWPNDIIIRNKKVCGVLIETHKTDSQLNMIVGIGLNVNQEDYSKLPNAGSLFTQTGKKFDLNEILSGLLTEMLSQYKDIEQKEFTKIMNEYNEHLFRKNMISVFEKDKIKFNGIIKSVNKNGLLEVLLEYERIVEFNHKEVKLHY